LLKGESSNSLYRCFPEGSGGPHGSRLPRSAGVASLNRAPTQSRDLKNDNVFEYSFWIRLSPTVSWLLASIFLIVVEMAAWQLVQLSYFTLRALHVAGMIVLLSW